ncbi:helix-turn-helix transcriptional regulator [Variovorax paradoxus]|uniref:helix-turn-helix transcriptional regulator n=1 Tax=Variovorax paradoxus TaxID=34073 RepID=UPI003D646C47
MQSEAKPSERLLRLTEVEGRTGLKKSSIYAAIRGGSFPASVRLSRRCVCWPASRIDAWIADRINGHTR